MLILLFPAATMSQDTAQSHMTIPIYRNTVWYATLQFDYGFIMVHRPSIDYLQKKHTRTESFSFLKKANGEQSWHRLYLDPYYGISYRFIDFGNSTQLGAGHAITAQMLFPLNKEGKTKLHLKPDIGIAYVSNPFDVKDNYKNLAIGSKLNACIGMSLQLQLPICRSWHISSGLSLMHISNGAARIPNLGLNIPSAFLSVGYDIKTEETPFRPGLSAAEFERKRSLTGLYIATGIKEIYPANGKTYPIALLNFQKHYSWQRKGWIGGGTEAIFDSSLPDKRKAEIDDENIPKPNTPPIRAGAYGSVGLQMGPWNAYLQTGLYLYNPVKSDGDVYNRLSVNYRLPSGIFFCLNLKSHFGKADYAEWGAGYSF